MSYEDFEQFQREEEDKRRRERRGVNTEQIEALKAELAVLKRKIEVVQNSSDQIEQIDTEIKHLQRERDEVNTILSGLGNRIVQLENEQKAKGVPVNFIEEDWEQQCDLMIKIADLHTSWNSLFDELLKIDDLIGAKRTEGFNHIDKIDEIINEDDEQQ